MAYATKITVTYDDGTVEELEKGLAFRFEEDEDTPEAVLITAEMVNMSGSDLHTVVAAAIKLGQKLGMFDQEADVS